MQVGEAEHLDAGHSLDRGWGSGPDSREHERLVGHLQLAEAIALGYRVVRTPDRIEAVSDPDALEWRERPEWIWRSGSLSDGADRGGIPVGRSSPVKAKFGSVWGARVTMPPFVLAMGQASAGLD